MIESIIMPVLAEDGATEAASGVEIVRAMLLVLGIVIIAVMLVIHARGKIARRQSDRPTPREQIDQAKAGGTERERWRNAATETSGSDRRFARSAASEVETARHLAALLDNKAERLEQLLAEAEERIAHLEGLVRDAAQSGSGSSAQTATQRSVESSMPANHEPHPPTPEPADPLTRSVYELADNGHSSVEIAQKLDEQVGKIDLILALRQ